MNIDNLHTTLKAEDVLNISPIIRKGFNNYEDAKLKRLSIFNYNLKSQSYIEVPGYEFIKVEMKDDKIVHLPEKFDMINMFKSVFQLFCGKIDDSLLFIDFGNLFCFFIRENLLDEYINSIFLNQERKDITENDLQPFKKQIMKCSVLDDFDCLSLEKSEI